MKLKSIALATMLALGASSAYAGAFNELTDGVAGQLSSPNGGLIVGANATAGDRLYLNTTSATYLSGFDLSNIDGEVVATAINYTASGAPTTNAANGSLPAIGASSGTLTLLDWQVTRDVALGVPGQFDYFDFVYRDSLDNKLVFGTRALNQLDNNEEANYLFRYGFTGYSTAAAWTFSTDFDLRAYQVGSTDASTHIVPVALDNDAVRFKSDVSVSEGNPWSGLFLVKTDATDYVLGNKAIGFGQAGEEGQAVVRGFIGGFIPTVAAVPEPDTYAMMLAGLGLMGFIARRRREYV